MYGLRDKNSKSRSQRPLNAYHSSSLSSNPMVPSEGWAGLPPESFVAGNLAKIAPLTFEVVIIRHIVEFSTTRVIEGTIGESTQRGSSSTEGGEATTYMISYDL